MPRPQPQNLAVRNVALTALALLIALLATATCTASAATAIDPPANPPQEPLTKTQPPPAAADKPPSLNPQPEPPGAQAEPAPAVPPGYVGSPYPIRDLIVSYGTGQVLSTAGLNPNGNPLEFEWASINAKGVALYRQRWHVSSFFSADPNAYSAENFFHSCMSPRDPTPAAGEYITHTTACPDDDMHTWNLEIAGGSASSGYYVRIASKRAPSMYLTAPVPGYGREAFFWPKTSSYRQIFFLYKTVAEKCQFSAGGGWC